MSELLARLYDPIMARTEAGCLAAWRAELLASVRGRVLELGAGTGANLHHYPREAVDLVLTEPDPAMRSQLARKAASFGVTPHIASDAAEALALDAASVDVVVSTLVLCSVREPLQALAEVRRVLRPKGRLVFLEHVAAPPGSSRRRWQERLDPAWHWLAGNCHLARDTERALLDAGFSFERVERASMRKAMPLVRPTIRGVAVAP